MEEQVFRYLRDQIEEWTVLGVVVCCDPVTPCLVPPLSHLVLAGVTIERGGVGWVCVVLSETVTRGVGTILDTPWLLENASMIKAGF